ncbi:MAG: class I SAM-dependent methyltransferase [Solirubrobacterales bacterium]
MEVVVPEIVSSFEPSSAVDLGCGDGQWTIGLARRGVRTVGVDSAEIDRDGHHLATFLRRDLTAMDSGCLDRSDICLCFEVAEHLPQGAADPLVALISSTSDIVLFSAAVPGQGGTGHLNEQPHSYWIDRFTIHGFSPDQTWRNRFSQCSSVSPWYRGNMIVFRR